jgi:hypothetical protein
MNKQTIEREYKRYREYGPMVCSNYSRPAKAALSALSTHALHATQAVTEILVHPGTQQEAHWKNIAAFRAFLQQAPQAEGMERAVELLKDRGFAYPLSHIAALLPQQETLDLSKVAKVWDLCMTLRRSCEEVLLAPPGETVLQQFEREEETFGPLPTFASR